MVFILKTCDPRFRPFLLPAADMVNEKNVNGHLRETWCHTLVNAKILPFSGQIRPFSGPAEGLVIRKNCEVFSGFPGCMQAPGMTKHGQGDSCSTHGAKAWSGRNCVSFRGEKVPVSWVTSACDTAYDP